MIQGGDMVNRSKLSWLPGLSGSFGLLAAGLLAAGVFAAHAEAADDTEKLRAGVTLMPTQVYSLEDDRRILRAFEGLRVADVSDGMDFVGLHDVGLVNPEIHPLWKDPVNYSHRIIGIAVTVRYVPTQQPPAGKRSEADFDKWVGEFYSQRSPEPFVPLLREGSVVVIEEAPETDVGSTGSNNIMAWKLAGAVGVITSNTSRDTDEIITQKVPLYLKQVGRGIRPGRNEVESVNRPIVLGGVLVMPGDVIVADGDGVIVVPRKVALEVARYAHKVIDGDKNARRDLYKKLGLPEDPSTK
jgi:4-hydroxy-4-methyl-2-oxoglutarate aldolase